MIHTHRETMTQAPTLSLLAAELAEGRTTSRALVEACLARAADPEGEGASVFIQIDQAAALKAAEAMDTLRDAGAEPSPFAGIPISIKDLFDIRGEVTRAGSTVLADAPPARADAVAVARLRRMGFVLIGRTNMTEFAYSGLGLNPHYGTPRNPWDRAAGRIPGGSSSGAAVSVTDGMAHAALGTDTGGSCRIPAALTGLVGYKPTASRVPLVGAIPLSTSLDSIGPIARSVGCCAVLDAILADEPVHDVGGVALGNLRLAVPTNLVFEDVDAAVGAAFGAALSQLSKAGARIEQVAIPEFEEVKEINGKGGFTAPESYAWHRDLLTTSRNGYDPRVSSRVARGETVAAADYIDALALRAALIARATKRLSAYDGIVMPTSPVVAPKIDDVATDDAYTRTNLVVLRNPTLINMIDGCAVSLPIHEAETAPVGLMLAGLAGSDRRILAIAATIERLFSKGASA
jgi:aspartyl-tRNA(Asn)/glutamyl-tRNA(Gln) amidotransferase subunit A